MSTKFLKLISLLLFSLIINPIQAAHTWEYYLEKASIEYAHAMYNDAIDNLHKALDLNPASYEAANLLGETYLRQKKYTKALESFSHSLSLKQEQEKIHIRVAELKQMFFENDSAIAHYNFVLRQNPQHAYAHLNLAHLLAQKKAREKALFHFEQAYQLKKGTSNPLKQSASAAQARGKKQDAIKLLQEALKENPADTDAYFQLALLYREEKKPAKAISCLEQLKYYRPYFEKTYIQLAHLYYTSRVIKSRKKKLDLALKNLLVAIKLNPDNYESFELLASLYRTLGMEPEAAKASQTAERLYRNKKN